MLEQRERRRQEAATAASLRKELNEAQLHTLRDLERFGWELKFVRRPPFQESIPVVFDGEDLMEVCDRLKLAPGNFVVRHNGTPLRVLATGFAPGFVYCGFHSPARGVPRREQVRAMVPAGTVLFAAGQTAIAATPIRTGWHVIGRTVFQNFDPDETPPTAFAPGDTIEFTVAM